jgi:Curli production assembly/transport component CsgG
MSKKISKNISKNNTKITILKLAAISSIATILAACGAMPPIKAGDAGSKTLITGATGGSTTTNANSGLPRCEQPLGTLAVNEEREQPWFLQFTQDTKLNSTTPLIRLMVQQSNCFVVVDRSLSGQYNRAMERTAMESGELRSNSNFDKGKMVAADFTLTPSINFSQQTSQAFGAIGGLFGPLGSIVAGGISKKEASVTLTLVENRSTVQIAASEGSASKFDFGGLGGLFGGNAGGVFGGYTNTPEKKVITASFFDAYSQMVEAVKGYKQQAVKGGLGTGNHQLQVQGANDTPYEANTSVTKTKKRK